MLSMQMSSDSSSMTFSRSISSFPARMVSSQSHSLSHPSRVTMIVGAISSNTCASSGVLPCGSRTMRMGLFSYFSPFRVRCGSSAMTVPTPTRMASYFFLRAFTRALSSSEEILTWERSSPAIFPSADMAQFTCMNGLMASHRG